MLERLVVERFKSIRSTDISFGRVNLFVGANGAGKSNILEAVGIVSAMLGRGISNAELSRKGVRQTPPELMKAAHKYRDLPRTLELTAQFSGDITYRCKLSSSINDASLRVQSESATFQNHRLFGRSPRGNKVDGLSLPGVLDKYRGMWDQIRAAYAFDKRLSDTFSEFSRYAIFSPQTDFLRGKKTGQPDDTPIGLHGEGLPNAVKALIRQSMSNRLSNPEEKRSEAQLARRALQLVYLPGWTRGVRVGTLDKHMISADVTSDSDSMIYFIDKYMRDDRNKLSAYDSSEGTLFLLFAAVLLAHKDAPKYFSFDNVDSALNPALTRTLVQNIIDLTLDSTTAGLPVGPRQVFLTSHNPTSLDAFDLFNGDTRAFVVSRERDSGDTVITRIEPRKGMTRTDWSIATRGKNLSQMWLEGHISGLGEKDEF
jgi:AAA15 family ATPase/GTPase